MATSRDATVPANHMSFADLMLQLVFFRHYEIEAGIVSIKESSVMLMFSLSNTKAYDFRNAFRSHKAWLIFLSSTATSRLRD